MCLRAILIRSITVSRIPVIRCLKAVSNTDSELGCINSKHATLNTKNRWLAHYCPSNQRIENALMEPPEMAKQGSVDSLDETVRKKLKVRFKEHVVVGVQGG